MGKTIGIFGGSFAPVHHGHTGVAETILNKGLVDEVWMMPCRRNPLKNGVAIADAERIALLNKAVSQTMATSNLKGRIKVDLTELDMPEPSYTWLTLTMLKEKYPKDKFRLIIGADSYNNFDKWMRSEWIAENFQPIVFPRPGYPIEEKKEGFIFIEGVEEYNVSSTELRVKHKMEPIPGVNV